MAEQDKPFKTIEEQVALLESRNLKTDERTPGILLREGYYQVVNGYKEPFLDSSTADGDDRFSDGTAFYDLYSLFRFDRDLREMTFRYLLRVEALLRTICAYTFAEAHQGTEDYLDQNSFATESEYRAYGLKHYRDDMQKLQEIMYGKARKSDREFIKHYRERHGGVPIWVLVGDMTFGNMEHFFNLMKPSEQALVCKRISEVTGSNSYFSTKEARIGLNLIVKARNMCAHDERMYCARIGKRQKASYVRLLGYISRYLPEKEFLSMVKDLTDTVNRYSGKSDLVGHVLLQMGFEPQDVIEH